MRGPLLRLTTSATRGRLNPRLPITPGIDPDSSISDAQLAWLLVDAVGSCLSGDERTRFFVQLGSGESRLALEGILSAIVDSRAKLPVAVLSELTRWLRGYAGSPIEPRLQQLLSDVHLQQFQVIQGGRASGNAAAARRRRGPRRHA